MGLGKPRSKYGEFLDRHKVKQEEISKLTGLHRDTVADICNNPENKPPRQSTMKLLLMAINQLTGKNASKDDFWVGRHWL